MTIVSVTRSVLKYERTVVFTALATVSALSWAYLLHGAGMGMSLAAMTAWPVTAAMPMTAHMAVMEWSVAHAVLMLVMWWVMMIAMMVPSAAPAILLFAQVTGQMKCDAAESGIVAPAAFFAAGYLVSWLGFSLAATSIQAGLEQIGLMNAMAMTSTSTVLSSGFLLMAGLYQFSAVKTACLDHCRTPVGFLVAHWRPGRFGALRMGARHGVYCIGCCWTLMALLFVGGIMNLIWIAGMSGLVLVEKVMPHGGLLGRAVGGFMISAGTVLLLQSILGG